MTADVAQIKKAMTAKQPKIETSAMLSSGNTVLNLALSGKPNGAFAKGKYYLLVGASRAGKTWIGLSALAEACRNIEFAKHRIIHDDAEGGALMNFGHYFGNKMVSRIEAPANDKDGSPKYSRTIEDFYFALDDWLAKGEPFIYVLDSMDAVSSEEAQEQFKKSKTAWRKGKELPGSYGDGKAKKNSQLLRLVAPRLQETGSILIIISQSRDNIGQFTFEKETRGGGRALTFYATGELWFSIKEKISRQVMGKKRQQGAVLRVKVKKTRHTGRDRMADITFFHSYGISDVDTCVDYLIEEGHWKVSKGDNGSEVKAPEFEFKGDKEALVKHIEDKGLEKELRLLVAETWDKIEKACEVVRKPRYE